MEQKIETNVRLKLWYKNPNTVREEVSFPEHPFKFYFFTYKYVRDNELDRDSRKWSRALESRETSRSSKN